MNIITDAIFGKNIHPYHAFIEFMPFNLIVSNLNFKKPIDVTAVMRRQVQITG